jgi:hypothetical protein
MAKKFPLSKIIRRTHLLLALFLTPWILMYAISTIAMHHRVLFTGEPDRVDPGFDTLSEETYTPTFPSDVDRQDAALQILRDLDLEGAFGVQGNLEEGRMTITRFRPIGSYRITYESNPGMLRVERQRFAMAYYLEMLHRRRGFQQPYVTNDLWAIFVDVVILAIILWAFTGVWMWWEMSKTRRLGAICLSAGVALFLVFLLTL